MPAGRSARVPPWPACTACTVGRRALERRLRQLGGMGIAGRLAGHRAQAEALGRVEAALFSRPSSKDSASDWLNSRNSSPSSPPSSASPTVRSARARSRPGAGRRTGRRSMASADMAALRGRRCCDIRIDNVGTIAVAEPACQRRRAANSLRTGAADRRTPVAPCNPSTPGTAHKSPECLRFRGRGVVVAPTVGMGIRRAKPRCGSVRRPDVKRSCALRPRQSGTGRWDRRRGFVHVRGRNGKRHDDSIEDSVVRRCGHAAGGCLGRCRPWLRTPRRSWARRTTRGSACRPRRPTWPRR